MNSIIFIIISFLSLLGITEVVIRLKGKNTAYKPRYIADKDYTALYLLPFIILCFSYSNLVNLCEMIIFILAEIISYQQYNLTARLFLHSLINLLRAGQYYSILEISPNIILVIPTFYLISYLDDNFIYKFSFFSELRVDRSHYLYVVSLIILYFYSLCFIFLGHLSFFLMNTFCLILFIFANLILNFEQIDVFKSNLFIRNILNRIKNIKAYISFISIFVNWLFLICRVVDSSNLAGI